MTPAPDVKSAFRNVRRGDWLSTTVVLILAVAVGAVTAIFSNGSSGGHRAALGDHS